MKSRPKKSFVYLLLAVIIGIFTSYTIAVENDQQKQEEILPIKQTNKITMDDTEWKEKLTPEQYRILRKAGTERPFGEVFTQTLKSKAQESMYVQAVIQNFSVQMKNLIPSVGGLPSTILQKPKM